MFERGKLVLVPFPFTELSAQKVRPAVIISREQENNDTVVVVFVSSVIPITLARTDVMLDPTKKTLAVTGLKKVSVVRCHKIATLDKRIILGEIGHVPTAQMKTVSIALRTVLHL